MAIFQNNDICIEIVTLTKNPRKRTWNLATFFVWSDRCAKVRIDLTFLKVNKVNEESEVNSNFWGLNVRQIKYCIDSVKKQALYLI